MTRDQRRILELLGGRTKRGQLRSYLKDNSAAEKEARRALAKELRKGAPLDLGLKFYIADLIDPDGMSDRRIRFVNRRRGNRSDAQAENDIAEFIWAKAPTGKLKKAVEYEVAQRFGIRRSRIRNIWRVWKPVLERRHRAHGPISKETLGKYWKI